MTQPVVHELLLIAKDHRHHVYIRTADEYRFYFSRRKAHHALDTYKKAIKHNNWPYVWNKLKLSNLPDQPYQVIKSTYITFPTIIEPEKTRTENGYDPTQLSSQNPPSP